MSNRSRILATAPLAVLLALTLASAAQAQAPASPAATAKAAVIKPGDNLVADGLPEIPAEIAEAVGRYTEFRSADLASWHPTKREILISTRFGDSPQVHEVRFPLGARRQLTFFPDRVGGSSWPRRSADYIVFTKDKGGDEFGQIHRLDVATGAITLLSPGGRSQNSLGPWSHQGDRMAFGSTRRNGADRDIYVMDPKDAASARMVLEVKGGGWGPADWSPDDAKLAVFEYALGQRELHLAPRRGHRREDARDTQGRRSRSPTAAPASAPTARGSTSRPTRSRSSSVSPASISRPARTPT